MRVGRVRRYAGVLDIPEGVSGPVQIHHKVLPAGTIETGSFRSSVLGGQKSESVTFEHETRWHELTEEGQGVWMTDLPIEQRQFDDIIRFSTGDVLIGGLGLGYAVLALAMKKRVQSITVVEKSSHVINLVWAATLAAVQKVRPDLKVTLVHADLFEYLVELRETPGPAPRFTWAVYDIWQSDNETTFHRFVVPLRRLSEGMVRKVECWNEDVMRGQLQVSLRTVRAMLESEWPSFIEMADLKLRCESDDLYLKWARPFWQWYRDHAATVSKEMMDWALDGYVRGYGHANLHDGLDRLRMVARYETNKKKLRTPKEAVAV